MRLWNACGIPGRASTGPGGPKRSASSLSAWRRFSPKARSMKVTASPDSPQDRQ